MPRPSVPIVAGAMAFFASGFAALVYQVAWQRILVLQSGVGLYSIAPPSSPYSGRDEFNAR